MCHSVVYLIPPKWKHGTKVSTIKNFSPKFKNSLQCVSYRQKLPANTGNTKLNWSLWLINRIVLRGVYFLTAWPWAERGSCFGGFSFFIFFQPRGRRPSAVLALLVFFRHFGDQTHTSFRPNVKLNVKELHLVVLVFIRRNKRNLRLQIPLSPDCEL